LKTLRRCAGILGWAVSLLWVSVSGGEELVSGCYRFIYDPMEFSQWEVEEFSREAEERCEKLKLFLHVATKEPIDVYVRSGQGVSTTVPHKNKAMDLFFLKPIRGVEAPIVHETAHIFLDSPNPVLREGLATAMEERFGTLWTHPTYGLSLVEWMKGLQCAEKIVGLAQLEKTDWREGAWEANPVAYVLSGSFVAFLLERYGPEEVGKALKWTQRFRPTNLERVCEVRFNRSLKDLEREWLETMKSEPMNPSARELCQALKAGKVREFLQKRLATP